MPHDTLTILSLLVGELTLLLVRSLRGARASLMEGSRPDIPPSRS
jgi:hypothetical protein